MTIINIKICSNCGAKSSLKEGFITERSLFKKESTICVTCHNYKHDSNALQDLKIHFYTISVGLIFILPDIAAGYGWLLINLSLFHLLSLFAIIVHELGHALASWLMGEKVLAICFGRGKTLFSKKIFGAYLDFNTIPAEGLMFAVPGSKSFLRTKAMIVTLTGPLVNLLIAWFIWKQTNPYDLPSSFSSGLAIINIMFVSNLLMGCVNLIPFRINSAAGKIWSDGGKLLTTPFTKKEQFEHYFDSAQHGHALIAFQHRDFKTVQKITKESLDNNSADRFMKNLLAVAMIEQGENKDARSIIKELIADDSVSDYEHAFFMNNLAYANYLINDPELLNEALEYSEAAFVLAPWELAVRSTRGSVLIENNQLEEGIKLLNDRRYKMLPNDNYANVKSALAIGYAKQGKMELARAALKKARESDQDNYMVKRAEEFIQKGI